MNANSKETVVPVLPVDESGRASAPIDWVRESGEYVVRLVLIAAGIFVGVVVAFIIAVSLGWAGVCG